MALHHLATILDKKPKSSLYGSSDAKASDTAKKSLERKQKARWYMLKKILANIPKISCNHIKDTYRLNFLIYLFIKIKKN